MVTVRTFTIYAPGCPSSPSCEATLKFRKQYCTKSVKLTESSFSDGNLDHNKSISGDVNLRSYLQVEEIQQQSGIGLVIV